MAKIFTNSYVRPVYFKVGESNGQQFYRRAPFDVVVINGATVLQPRSLGVKDQAISQFNLGAEEQQNWRENDLDGYETLNPIVLNENQMGDGSDNWMGVHSFSNI